MAKNKKRVFAISSAAAALLLALALLLASGFAVADILRGAKELGRPGQYDAGVYAVKNIDFILDFYCEEYGPDGKTTAWYAVVPQDGVLVTYILPRDHFDSAETIMYDTYDWLNGAIEERSRYFAVKGTVEVLSPGAEERLYGWFSQTSGWLREAGVIGETEDYADHLSPYAVRVGYIGSVTETAAYVMSGLSALLLLYAVVIAIGLGRGRYGAGEPGMKIDPREEKED